MGEAMSGLKRSHYCTDVTEEMIGQEVTLMGWVNKRRDLGQLIFVTLRDRTGIVQITFDENGANGGLFKKAESIRGEYVLAVKGVVRSRGEKDFNQAMKTGKIEIEATELKILSEAETPPFQVADENVSIDLRLKHRYLDLRREALQKNLILRHNLSMAVREFLSKEGFLDIETPYLTKSTPEGARDYLVPSRIYPGSFYALPQSPQIFKQLLMVSGFDKYFQIAKCFRDEDLRADRQPEFTQIDMELSFVEMEDVISVNERLMQHVFKAIMGVELKLPFPRITYEDAMNRYGSDKPDIRFGLELKDISNIVKGSEFQAFENAINDGGSVKAINAKCCADMSRKQIDKLSEIAKQFGTKGLSWITLTNEGEAKTSLSKFFDENKIGEIVKALEGEKGDLILICADKTDKVLAALGSLRLEIAKIKELTKADDFCLLWVTEFPLFEWAEEENRFYAKHHPFTSPLNEDIPLLETNPGQARAKAYDIVLNGFEIGGGSIRIHQRDVQEKMFELLGFSKEDAQNRFGFMMDAFKYGTPPHGGLAYGLDRIAMILTNSQSLRDVIAFPKVKDASCPMTDAPGQVDEKQLQELKISIIKE